MTDIPVEEWGNGTLALAAHLFKGVDMDNSEAVDQRRAELVEWDTALRDEARGGPKNVDE